MLSFAELMSPLEKEISTPDDVFRAWNDEERYLTGRIHYGHEMAGYLIDTNLHCAALSLPHVARSHESTSPTLPPLLLNTLKDEDEEAYHLISEYTLHVEVTSPNTVEERLEIMHRNTDFRRNPAEFREHYAKMSEEVRNTVRIARERIPSITISTKVLALIARMTILDKQSLRLDVLMEQLARTNAAFEGRTEVDSTDVMEAADLSLMHRLTPRELSDFERGSAIESARAQNK
jgi:MoxR-like ATPase